MDDEHTESMVEKIKGIFKNAFGLPPGDKTPHGVGELETDPETPDGTLTADDAEDLPPRGGTGIAVE